MKPENAIEVSNVKKAFRLYEDKPSQLKEVFVWHNFRHHEKREVLGGISFEVQKGKAVGLIGRNGCGKSTTLKMLTKILEPDEGKIEMQGRVSSLIELGAGFHPDMSGRENIYINASIFGIRKKEIDKRVDEIIRFSELEEFIDSPVRTYSSGMYMRLAFSVAINVDAEILLIDEILAVGDIAFQEKCFNKLIDLKETGITIVLVSHALGQVERLCDTAIWIDDGLIREIGNPYEVNAHYVKSLQPQMENTSVVTEQVDEMSTYFDLSTKIRYDPGANGHVRFLSAEIMDHETNQFQLGEDVQLKVRYRFVKDVGKVAIRYTVYNKATMKPIATAMSPADERCLPGVVKATIINMKLGIMAPGEYLVRMQLFRPDEFGIGTKFDVVEDAVVFSVSASKDEFYHLGWHEDAWGNVYISSCDIVEMQEERE